MTNTTKKIETVLLIDDDEGTNFLNSRTIKNTGLVNNIVVARSGAEAIAFLKVTINEKHAQPELIFLDINMPMMNGWEFMEAYNELEKNQKGEIVIVMLSTSLNPDDRKRAESIENIDDFRNKPLTMNMFIELVQRFFPNCFANN